MANINVTKTFLPPIEEYEAYLQQIWQNGQLTNQGPLLHEFEDKLAEYMDIENFHFVTNGTVALQVAMRALGVSNGEVITTPFSYVATTSAILWEGCKPVFVDIDPKTLTIDVEKIESAISPDTKAILAVHVFGNPCNVERIDKIAKKHNLKVIYDAAHAFGVSYQGNPLINFGDISIYSFHATKVFHTIEGGGIVVKDSGVSERVELIKRFGHNGDEHLTLGINAKASEFQAAMGLCNLKHIDEIILQRKKLAELYDNLLGSKVGYITISKNATRNYAYYPIILENENALKEKLKKLNEIGIFPRRYFYPSLNTLRYINEKQDCPVSEDVASRILCLPLYADLEPVTVRKISETLTA
jgi:dTDP-4-amino-4,6-dideoxygalactose transaminase